MAKKRVPHAVDPAEIEKNAAGTPQYTFANTLNRLMEEKGIDQEKMAEDLRLSTGIIHNYRHGKTEPKLSAIVNLANYLHVDCHYLLTGVKAENSTLAKDIGLNETSINLLKGIYKSYGGNSPETDVLNDLFKDVDIRDLLLQIAKFKRIKKQNRNEMDNCRSTINEVKAGIVNGISRDILLGRLSIPLCRLEDIEPSERYQRFLAIDSFTSLFDSVYCLTDFSEVNRMLQESISLHDTLDSEFRDSIDI